jgi:disulfide bond formation protein DsbB
MPKRPTEQAMAIDHPVLNTREPTMTAAIVIAVVGAAALVGAWFFQYGLGMRPCPLCLEQRIAYYFAIPLAAMIILGVAYGAKPRILMLALLAIALGMLWNAGLGSYHAGVEWKWWPGPRECSGGPDFSTGGNILDRLNNIRIVRCDEPAWRDPVFGLSLAGYNVLISLALAAVAFWGALGTRRGRPDAG